ncbi:MAG: LamG domain-containing protein [Pseudoalteromonas sp.]|uniref:LamG domain-containing protein n=1 Tax=Pseudoalteromonas sp. TaxID=53249 RepID=UPI001DE24971|nr:LamG domain-containing protein [Pseudoalteromonas sp.]NRA77862.1 LamG domain-containing protein [Pseudoalteromonas sp.]
MTIKIYKDQNAGAVFIENANGVQFLNALQATMDEPTDVKINIHDLSKDVDIFTQVPFGDFVDQNGATYGANATDVCNALNAEFAASGSSTGVPPTITSATTVNLTGGDTLNYELVATKGVGYEWANLPSGVVTVEGNVRKLVGGSSLSAGTYNITAKAVNYYGEDTETISLVVSSPPYSNTRSVNFQNQDYLGANASLVDGILGRASNGSGSGDAWSISMWFKGSNNSQGQTIFYFGDQDTVNQGYIQLMQINSSGNKLLRLKYGSNGNNLRLQTPAGSILPNTWQHVLVTYDGGTTGAGSTTSELNSYYSRFKIYIDGALQSTNNSHSNYGWTQGINPDNFRIGRFSSGNYMRDCRVDELALWGSDQSGNISDIYNSGSTHDLELLGTPPNHWWRMGDGDTFPNIQDNIGSAIFVMYNMTAADIVTDAP